MGRIRTPITAALLALTTMTGCSGDPTPTARAMPAEQVAVMVMTSGGMIPPVVAVLQSPSLVVYGDGRVLSKVPAPALQLVPARYEVADVGPEAVRAFVSSARSGGLISEATDFGSPPVTDLGTTTVLLHGDGEPSQVRVYAFDERFEHDLSPAQRDARAGLRALIARAADLAAGTPRMPYVPDRVIVSEPMPGRNQEPASTPWPGPPPSTFLIPTRKGRAVACGELLGADASTVYLAALDNSGARWLVDGETRVLGVNPVPLPGACP
ncbi:MAG: hypothetical protein KDB56_16955 [Mycobacterium sp.]|nr:hypothetical protein [Mycobacterium sp.]